VPAESRWLPEVRTMLVSHHGRVTVDDLRATDRDVFLRCEGQGPDVRYLGDFRGCQIEMTKEEVLEHAVWMNDFRPWDRIPGFRVAVVFDVPLETALAMLFRMRTTKYHLEIFSSVEGAWDFLELDHELLSLHEDFLRGKSRP